MQANDDVAIGTGYGPYHAHAGNLSGTRLAACGAETGWVYTHGGRVTGRIHQRPHHGCLHRHVEMLPSAGDVPRVDRRYSVCGSLHARVQVCLGKPHRYRGAVTVALHAHEPSRSFDGEVRCGQVYVGSGLAPRRDRNVNERRVATLKVVIAQSDCAHVPRVRGFDEDICRMHQSHELGCVAGVIEVDDHAVFAVRDGLPIQRSVRLPAASRRVVVERWAAPRVRPLRRLDDDNLGP